LFSFSFVLAELKSMMLLLVMDAASKQKKGKA
jgi:hypothetical protein